MLPQIYFDKVKHHFDGDVKKTWKWFNSTHPALGMLSPLSLVKLNQEKKVISLIEKEMR